jgi:hypothetical protein
LWRNQQTEARLVLRPKQRNRHSDFEAQITKPKLPVLRTKPGNPPPPWFWGSTKKPTASFEAKSGEIIATSFKAKLEKTVATGFEAKPEKTVAVGFEAKPPETVWVVLRPKHLQTIDLGFKAQPRNPRSSSSHARCRPASFAPGLLLLPQSSSLHAMPHLPPAHHKTSKRDSPNENKDKRKTKRTYPGFKFKPHQVNDSAQSNQGTDHLVFQSPPWWVHWQQKHKVWSLNPRSHEAQLEDPKSQEKLKKVI